MYICDTIHFVSVTKDFNHTSICQKVTVFMLYVADPARCHEGVSGLHEQPYENCSLGRQHGALNRRQSPSKAVDYGHGGGRHTAAALPTPHPAGTKHTHSAVHSNFFWDTKYTYFNYTVEINPHIYLLFKSTVKFVY